MNILGFDTGLNKTYLALAINDDIYTEIIESTEEKYHSAYLIQEIVNILEKHNFKPQDIDLIATNIGPGSFTGIRVGLTVARVFAQSTDINTVGINSLELIANRYGLPSIAILDARKNKAYVGNDENVKLIDLDNLKEHLQNFEGIIVADTKMTEFLASQNINSINFEAESKDYAQTLIELAKNKYNNNEYTKWQGLKPLYIQPPPIHQKV